MQLRPYQLSGKQAIHTQWLTHRNVVYVLPTGGGKTVLFADTLAEHTGACVAIAHRQELVSQISLTLARYGVRHRIIGPQSVVRFIVALHMEVLGRSFYDPNALCAVAGVDTLIRRADSLERWLPQVGLWVMDECFPAGILVDGRPIEDIQVGDYVDAYDEVKQSVSKKRVTRLFKNVMPDNMVRLDIGGHHVLHCTEGHPVFTRRGWIPAAALNTNDEVLRYELYGVRKSNNKNYRTSTLPIPENRPDLLPESMWPQISRPESATPRNSYAGNDLLYVPEESDDYWRTNTAVYQTWTGVLWQKVFGGIPESDIFRNYGPNQSEVRSDHFETNDRKQSYALCGNPSKSFSYPQSNGPQTPNTRGERKTAYQSRSYALYTIFGAWLCITTRYKDWSLAGWFRIPSLLQTGYGSLGYEDSHRSRWAEPQCFSPASARQEKRRVLNWVRLDGVTIQKQSDTRNSEQCGGDGYVYNIEVEDLHTYIANGVVVHNCHHVLDGNKWGKAVAMFPNAKGLGVTANTRRADGKGLGKHADGVADALIVGPSMRELINAGYLTDYRIFAPPSDLDVSDVKVSRVTGDYNPNQLKVQVQKSHIIGDVVTHYKRIAPGKLGITFAIDVEEATNIAAQFNAGGVPAAVVSAKTPDRERMEIQRRFVRREILQMVNVNLFGEGYDVPGLEVMSMARPTESFNLYCQMMGRPLRLMEGKTEAIIIDHEGNTLRHGLPDAPITWTLDRRERRTRASNSDLIPTRVCTECMSLYERVYVKCPWCGHILVPAVRSGPEFVDGDLLELDAATLAAMRGEVASVDRPDREIRDGLERAGSPAIAAMGAAKQHRLRQDAQTELRAAIALWAGKQRAEGRPDSESYRRFYFRYKIDVMSAQALGRPDAEALCARIKEDM